MNNVFLSALLGYLTDFLGIGAGALGAASVYALKKKYINKDFSVLNKNMLFSLIFEFSSGLMMAIVTFSLIPKAVSECGTAVAVIGILLGLIFVFFVQRLAGIENNNLKTGMVMLINLWLHNIPEGFILGTMSCTDIGAAFLFFAAILLHNIPQGFLISIPIMESGIKRRSLTYLSLFSGIPTVLGSIAGAAAGGISSLFTGFMLGFASGSMLYVLIFELSYEARRMYGKKIIELAYIAGLIFGILIS